MHVFFFNFKTWKPVENLAKFLSCTVVQSWSFDIYIFMHRDCKTIITDSRFKRTSHVHIFNIIIVDMQLLYVVRKMIPWINMPMNEFLKGHYLITVLATMSIVGGIEKTLTTLKCIIRLWKIFNWRICNTVQNGI